MTRAQERKREESGRHLGFTKDKVWVRNQETLGSELYNNKRRSGRFNIITRTRKRARGGGSPEKISREKQTCQPRGWAKKKEKATGRQGEGTRGGGAFGQDSSQSKGGSTKELDDGGGKRPRAQVKRNKQGLGGLSVFCCGLWIKEIWWNGEGEERGGSRIGSIHYERCGDEP